MSIPRLESIHGFEMACTLNDIGWHPKKNNLTPEQVRDAQTGFRLLRPMIEGDFRLRITSRCVIPDRVLRRDSWRIVAGSPGSIRRPAR